MEANGTKNDKKPERTAVIGVEKARKAGKYKPKPYTSRKIK